MAKESTKDKPAGNSPWLFFGRFLRWLVEPAASVAAKDRQKIRLLSGFLLVITINSLAGAVIKRGMGLDAWINLLVITVVFVVAYGLSRTRYYRPALIIALVAPALNVVGVVVTTGADSTGIILALAWLVLPFLLASIFLSRRTTLFVAIGYFVFIVSIFPFTRLTTEFTGELIAFSLMVAFMVIAITVIRQRDQTRVERALAERTAAEGALADEVTRRRILVDESRDGIVVLDEKGKVYEANRRFAEMLGYTPEEVRKLSVWDWEAEFPPEQVAEMVASIGPEGDHFETRHRRKDGTFYDVEISTNGAVFAGQKLIFCVCRDITERQQMEQALRESEDKFSKAFRSHPTAVALSTMKDGKFREVNEAFLRNYGYSREEVIGHSSKELGLWVTPKDRVRILRVMQEKGQVLNEEFKARKKSGEIRTMTFSAEPIDIAGERCIIASTDDITERKRMEEAIQAEKNKMESLIGAMDCTLTIQDRDFNIIYQNEASRLASGGDHIGEKCYRVYEGRETVGDGCPVAKAFKDGKSHTSERQRLEPSGEITFWENTANPIKDAEGNIVSCVEVARDITERKKTEEVIRKSEERYRTIFESTNDVVVLLDNKGRIVDVNPRIVDVGGYSRDQVIGKDFRTLTKIMPKKSVAILAKNFVLMMLGRDVSPYEVEMYRGDGTKLNIEVRSVAIKDRDKIIGVLANLRDVTERKQMEEALRESEEKYKTLTEDAPIGIYFNDFGGTFLFGNKRAEEIVGYKRDELLGQSFLKLKLISPRDIGRAAKLLALNKLGRATGPDRFVINRKDGTRTIVEIRTRITTVGGKKLVLGMVEDITEREKAESALKYQRELIDQIIATIPNAVLVIDEEMKVLLANDTFYKHFGLKKAGVESKPIYDIIDEEELKLALKDTIQHNKKGHYLEFRYLLKGVPRIFVATIVKMQNNRYLVFLNDITEEREKQERLYLTDRLASVGEMASGVAHELNNPLTSIIGLSSLLAKQDMPAENKEDLEAINAEAQRCAAIVKNLLAFARKHAPNRQPLSVTKVVEDVLKLRAYEHRSHNVIVETDLPDGLPQVEADYFQLQQVFLNIILNAETAMVDANGQGTLRITGDRTDGYVRLSFSDNGPGIDKKNMGLIFNPFFTTKAVGKGTGLGLSISYGIIAAHGGKIQAKNNSNKGVTFTVELPVIEN